MKSENVGPTEEMSVAAQAEALLEGHPDIEPGSLDPTTVFSVRPMVYQCYEPVALLVAGIAKTFPIEAPIAPILGQAVLRDLAWLCSYLREVEDTITDLEPARQAVLDFLFDTAPDKTPEWLEVQVPEEPLRWAFRVRTSRDLGDMMTRLARTVVAAHDLLHLEHDCPHTLAIAALTTMAELELAMGDVPVWKPQLRKIHRLAAQALATEGSQVTAGRGGLHRHGRPPTLQHQWPA